MVEQSRLLNPNSVPYGLGSNPDFRYIQYSNYPISVCHVGIPFFIGKPAYASRRPHAILRPPKMKIIKKLKVDPSGKEMCSIKGCGPTHSLNVCYVFYECVDLFQTCSVVK